MRAHERESAAITGSSVGEDRPDVCSESQREMWRQADAFELDRRDRVLQFQSAGSRVAPALVRTT